jgi:ribosomal protein S27AE
MKILSDAPGMREFTVNDGKVIKRQRDGGFQVSTQLGKALAKTGEWTVAGTTLRTAQGFTCQDCGFVAVFRDHCGKCGGTHLIEE